MADGIIRVGISGWTYAPWRGVFYPKGLKPANELPYAATQFRAVEISDTFYGLPRPELFAAWAGQVPADFVFPVKAPRLITHVRRLRDIETPLADFIASGLLRLGIHLGPILWQFPPNFRFEKDRMEAFLRLLPHDTARAAKIGARRSGTPHGLAVPPADANRPVRHAIEVRHDSFRCPGFIDLLRACDVALVCSDSVARPRLMDITSDFAYLRLHASAETYPSGYGNDALDAWARRIRAWACGDEPEDADRIGPRARRRRRDVFVFFDNDLKVRAPANAMELIRRLHLSAQPVAGPILSIGAHPV
jgi:uncharacterized protein YecE (DUF72 family)